MQEDFREINSLLRKIANHRSLTKRQIKNKLAALVKLCNELHAEAKRRYGDDGQLFYESSGAFHVMAGDCEGKIEDRISFIRFSSEGACNLGAGAW